MLKFECVVKHIEEQLMQIVKEALRCKFISLMEVVNKSQLIFIYKKFRYLYLGLQKAFDWSFSLNTLFEIKIYHGIKEKFLSWLNIWFVERKQRVRANLRGREGIGDTPQGSVWRLCFSARLLVFWKKKRWKVRWQNLLMRENYSL